MNRREAIALCCYLPAATTSMIVQEKMTPTGPITVLSNKTSLQLTLTDDHAEEGGVTVLRVIYKGKTVEISAKEIWEALQP